MLTEAEQKDIGFESEELREISKRLDQLGGRLSSRPLLTGTRAGVRVASRMALMASDQLLEAIRFGSK